MTLRDRLADHIAKQDRGDWIELAHTGDGRRKFYRWHNGQMVTRIDPISGHYGPA